MKHIERVLKKTGIITVSPSDQLSTALGKLKSSHDAAFVFDDNNIFLGIINPYHALIRSWTPGKSKVEHHVFHPPHISPADGLDRIAQMMMESKVHYLPVFDEENTFMGITSARRVLSIIQTSTEAESPINQILAEKKQPLTCVMGDDSVGKAIELFKTHKFSKLVVIDANMKLKGVLSYYDLIPYMIAPGVSKKNGGRGREVNRDREIFLDKKVKHFAKTTTLMMNGSQSIAEAIGNILSHNIGSVVVIDGESHPVGILTTRDILQLLIPKKISKHLEVVKKNVSGENMKDVDGLIEYVQGYIDTYEEINTGRMIYEEEKNGGIIRVKIELQIHGEKPKIFEIEGRNCQRVLTQMKRMMKVKK